MKPLFKMLMAIAILTGAVGCAKDSGTSNVNACIGRCDGSLPIGTGGTGTGIDPSQTGYTGSTVPLTNSSGLYDFFYLSQPRQPTNVRINIDMARPRDSVIVSYTDAATGRYVEAAVGTIHPQSGFQSAIYNGWTQENGRSVYKGFFQDAYGALIVIINRTSSMGDGQPGTQIGGEVWYQNFPTGYQYAPVQGPEKMCWEITMGPYDCRSFILFPGNKYERVVTNSATTPTTKGPDAPRYYNKLGEFDGINATAANFPVQ
jgi:hypothetical protein